MLLAPSNAVGYTNYPDNVVQAFVKEAAQAGNRHFRVFDALNGRQHAGRHGCGDRIGNDLRSGDLLHGDITNPVALKYDLKYYIQWPKNSKRWGPTSWLSRIWLGSANPRRPTAGASPQARNRNPHPFPHHDTAGIQAASILQAAQEGLEIADGALALSPADLASQPQHLVESLRLLSPREPTRN